MPPFLLIILLGLSLLGCVEQPVKERTAPGWFVLSNIAAIVYISTTAE